MKRRHFLRSAAASATAFSAPQLLLRGAEPEHPIIGEGNFRYECYHDWGKLPPGHHYGGATHGVAFDSQGFVYISHQGGPGSVFVFDPKGMFVRSLAPQHEGEGHGIDIRREGNEDFIYLSPNSFAHRNNPLKATKMTVRGEVVWEGGPPPESRRYNNKESFNATNISFCPDGGWHVGDGYGSSWIHRYDKEGRYVCSFGGKGKEIGQFDTPHGHWLDTRDGIPRLVVCDRANSRLQIMTLDGQPLSVVTGIDRPASLDIRGDLMLCTEVFIGRLVFLDRNYQVLARLGDDEAWVNKIRETRNFRAAVNRPQWQAGKFVHPHDAAFDRNGNIIVTEWVEGGRVTFLKKLS